MAKRKGKLSRAFIELDGIEEYLHKLEKLEKDTNRAAVQCVEAAEGILYKDMKQDLERHRRTGAAVNALQKIPVKAKNDTVTGEVGTFAKDRSDKNFEGYLHSRYIEFGTPTFKGDPWLRTAMDDNHGKIMAAWKSILKRWGVPMD